MKRIATIGLMLLAGLSVNAQKKELIIDKEVILARAAEAFDAALQPGAELHATVVEEELIGRYVLQVSIRDHGDVSSVFVVSAEGHDIRSQNRFKDLVYKISLPFKMPKGKQYRLEHAFDLDALRH